MHRVFEEEDSFAGVGLGGEGKGLLVRYVSGFGREFLEWVIGEGFWKMVSVHLGWGW